MTKQPVKGEGGTRNKREEERLKPVKPHIQRFLFQIRERMRLGQTVQCCLIKCHTIALSHICLAMESYCVFAAKLSIFHLFVSYYCVFCTFLTLRKEAERMEELPTTVS